MNNDEFEEREASVHAEMAAEKIEEWARKLDALLRIMPRAMSMLTAIGRIIARDGTHEEIGELLQMLTDYKALASTQRLLTNRAIAKMAAGKDDVFITITPKGIHAHPDGSEAHAHNGDFKKVNGRWHLVQFGQVAPIPHPQGPVGDVVFREPGGPEPLKWETTSEQAQRFAKIAAAYLKIEDPDRRELLETVAVDLANPDNDIKVSVKKHRRGK